MSPTNHDELPQVRIFPSAGDFRAWLERNHDRATELWIGYYKKGVAKASMTYLEAVEEALCFGWIDGQARRISEEVAGQRFTPRRRGSGWSAINIARMAELEAAGRVHPSGRRAFEERDRRKDASYSYERPPQSLPDDWRARFESDANAWSYWQSETPSYRRTATHWVLSAKRPETRDRRFSTLIAESAAGRRVKPFLVERRAAERPSPRG
jgi:uncharacterized protein YdeI (YjbR/CyaY-like superfamily)